MRGREGVSKANIFIQVKNEYLVKFGVRVGSLGSQKFYSNSGKRDLLAHITSFQDG